MLNPLRYWLIWSMATKSQVCNVNRFHVRTSYIDHFHDKKRQNHYALIKLSVSVFIKSIHQISFWNQNCNIMSFHQFNVIIFFGALVVVRQQCSWKEAHKLCNDGLLWKRLRVTGVSLEHFGDLAKNVKFTMLVLLS